jgi:hypothetical protein
MLEMIRKGISFAKHLLIVVYERKI